MEKKLTVTGCALWIIGFAASITGLNLHGDARTWVSIAGNVIFLIGLGITGAVWIRKKRTESKDEEKR